MLVPVLNLLARGSFPSSSRCLRASSYGFHVIVFTRIGTFTLCTYRLYHNKYAAHCCGVDLHYLSLVQSISVNNFFEAPCLACLATILTMRMGVSVYAILVSHKFEKVDILKEGLLR